MNAGSLLLGELNCLSCHKPTAGNERSFAKHVQTKQAPILDEVGARARPEFLREYLAAPHKAKPGTTMPDLLASVDESERAATVEALVHFLASTGKAARGSSDYAGRCPRRATLSLGRLRSVSSTEAR